MSTFSRFLKFMTKPLVVVICLLTIILCILYVDKPLAEFLNSMNLRTNFSFLNWFTKLGLGIVYFVLLFIAALFFRYVRKNRLWEERMWFLWLSVIVPSTICVFLKVMLGRARPSLWFESKYYGFFGLQYHAPYWSFPSGHTTTIMGLALGLCVIFPRYCYTFLITGFLVAASRVLLTHHYLSDVLTASYITFLEVGLLLWVLEKKSWLRLAWKDAIK